MYSFNREGKTYGEMHLNLKGKESLDSPGVRISVPHYTSMPGVVGQAGKHVRFTGISYASKMLYKILA